MSNISRDMALCMFYCKAFTEENIALCKKRLRLAHCEICYNVTPNQPVLVTPQRILSDPLTYRKYLDVVVPAKEEGEKRKRLELHTEAQVVQFINHIYCIDHQGNDEMFEKKLVSTQELFDTVKEFSALFEEKTLLSFARWCSTHKVSFLKARENKNGPSRRRELYVMKDVYYDSLLTSICEYLPNYQQTLKNLESEEIEIIGYVRKSPSSEDHETRVRLLQSMINNLRSRSLVTRTYVSAISRSSTPFHERDLKRHDAMYDMLKYLQSVKHDVCLVCLDFAGLSSRSHHVKELLEQNPSIKKIAIETFAVANQVCIYNSNTLMSDVRLLEKFDCRPKPVQRSK